MFPPNFWLSDPFDPFTTNKRHSPTQTHYPYDYYNTSTPPQHHRGSKKPTYTPSTSVSDLDTITDADTYSPYDRAPKAHHRQRFDHISSQPYFHPFTPLTLRLPPTSAQSLHPSEILILPSTLTHLKISLEPTSSSRSTIRAAVPPSMRLRDVIKQMVPSEHLAMARVYVKLRGEWVEAGAPVRVGECGELGRCRGEESVRVKVVVVEQRERVESRGFGFEMGGRIEKMRIY